jgi:hypothetical protein
MFDDKHLAFVRTLPSVISGQFGVEACHIRFGDGRYNKPTTGKAQKPSDCWVLPLTPEEHRDQHSRNEVQWWKSHGIDPCRLANEIYQLSGDYEEAVRAIVKARMAL